MTIEVVPAARAGWPSVAALFDGPGDPGGCFCQWFRQPNAVWKASSPGERRAALEAQLVNDPGPGVVAVRAGEPVAWCAVAPLAGYPRLTAGRTPLTAHLAAGPGAWAVTCFVVPREHRRQGLTHALLDGAIAHARDRGAASLDGYPVDSAAKARIPAADLYHGPLSLFLAHGFAEVARPSAARAVVRLTL